MATRSSVLAWRIPGTEGVQWAAVYGVAQSRTRLKRLSMAQHSILKIGNIIPKEKNIMDIGGPLMVFAIYTGKLLATVVKGNNQ